MVTKKTCYGNAESRVDNVVSFPLMTVCIMIILMTSYGNGTMLRFGYVGISLGMIVVDSVLFVLLSYISDRERKLRLLQLQQTRAQERLKCIRN